ncbi:MAG: hybrid sensor histidine kinase/response regulator, partial [Rugosibacter sp.]|nr:hybrid sensor histidine kinase/response regulator [Rugosibacter sp.]
MSKKNDDFLIKLLATFRGEADEHLRALSTGLLALEKAPADGQQPDIVEKIFRETHSLKGAARAVNLGEIESVCQALESVFAALKGKAVTVSPMLLDLLHQAEDTLGALLAPDAAAKPATAPLIRRLEGALRGSPPPVREASVTVVSAPAVPEPVKAAPPPELTVPEPVPATGLRTAPATPGLLSETIRISTAKLGSVMRQSEELLAPRLAAGQRARELREMGAMLADWKKRWTRIRPTLQMIEHSVARVGSALRAMDAAARDGKENGAAREQQAFARLFDYLDAESLFVKTIEARLARLSKSAEHDHRALAGQVDSLLYDVKEMHLLPFSSLLEAFPRFVRELARDQGKLVELVIHGGDLEIDRRILEKMKDALIHMIRNCIDHGIETPAVREQKQKTPRGTITLAIVQQDSGKAEMLVTDDGMGIDAGKVKAVARKLGLVSAEEAARLGEHETLMLAFRSGISTSPIITDISGRGLGLAIVREKVERLGGTVALESRPDVGTTFRIILPLTLANFRSILVSAGGQFFVIPAASVERVARVADSDIRTVENRETISLDGQAVSLVRLGDVLGLPAKAAAGKSAGNATIVLGLGPARIAFQVDEVLGEQEALVKPLGPQLVRVRNIAGASVLGTGQVVPVLNVPDLMKSAVRPALMTPRAADMPVQSAEKRMQSVLVVEDSITSRALLKNILESAGYAVTTAVDGVDAYTALKTAAFDLVVSDVEMPRMDGFDLTAKVRSDKQLAELPIVLVTALESNEHRERGIDVGA